MAGSEVDELFEVRNNFYLTNYAVAIQEANTLSDQFLTSEVNKIERDTFLYRSYISQRNYKIVLDEIDPHKAPLALQAVRTIALYLSNSIENREIVLDSLKTWMGESSSASNPTLLLIYGTVLSLEGNIEEAMRAVHSSHSLEGIALLVQLYIKINRVDLAEKSLKDMQKLDDDATLTQLATAWVCIAQGGNKFIEAFNIYQDLIEKYSTTSALLNGTAVCNLHMKKYAEAEKALNEALEKQPNDPDTLVNLIVVCHHLRKSPQVFERYLKILRSVAPQHGYVTELDRFNTKFDEITKRWELQAQQ